MRPIDSVWYREATSADAAAMAACRLEDADAGAADHRMAAYFDGLHHPQKALLPRVGYAALSGDTVIGYIAGHLTRRYGYDGEVQYLYVAPGHRRRGVASALLRLLAGWFQERGVTRVCVNADPDSPPAVPFYTSQGASALNRYWYVWEDVGVVSGVGVPRQV
jgi:GNAT superfamily N-acetyltransferase